MMSKAAISIINELSKPAFAGNFMLHKGMWVIIWRPWIIDQSWFNDAVMPIFVMKFTKTVALDDEDADSPVFTIVSEAPPS